MSQRARLARVSKAVAALAVPTALPIGPCRLCPLEHLSDDEQAALIAELEAARREAPASPLAHLSDDELRAIIGLDKAPPRLAPLRAPASNPYAELSDALLKALVAGLGDLDPIPPRVLAILDIGRARGRRGEVCPSGAHRRVLEGRG